ncbi:MAG: potassium channel family protein [Porticoccaceae bacterium]
MATMATLWKAVPPTGSSPCSISAYFSFTTYSSLGYGDVVPFNNLRFVAGLEALIGLVMITWSASFMYLEMARFWEKSNFTPPTPSVTRPPHRT